MKRYLRIVSKNKGFTDLINQNTEDSSFFLNSLLNHPKHTGKMMGKHIIRKNILKVDFKETILIVSLYCFVAITSIINLGIIAGPVFLFLFLLCSLYKPRTGLIALLSMFYLPTGGINIPYIFVISTAIVALMNLGAFTKIRGYRINGTLIVLYSVFLVLRFVSVTFVEDFELFYSYFFVSFTVLIHLIVISSLVENKEDIDCILLMWGIIGALSALLGYVHYLMQDNTYLRQVVISTGAIDKSTLMGSLDYVRWIWAGAEPNFTGLQLLIPLAINFHFMFKYKRILNILTSLMTFLGILGTYSRSSFLVALVVLFIYFLMIRSKVKYVVLVFTVASTFAIITLFSEFADRINSIQETIEYEQGSGRFPLYEEALNNFWNNPLFGVGTGQTRLYSATHRESHNLFLQTLGENGLLSFIVLIILFYYHLKKAIAFRREKIVYIVAIIAIMLNACTVSCFDMRVLITLFVLLNYEYYFRSYPQQITKKNSYLST